MPTTSLDRLLYAIDLDMRDLNRNVKTAENTFARFGKNTSVLLQRTLGREFAKTIDPSITDKQLSEIVNQIKKRSPEAAKAFSQAFNRRAAQAAFRPFIKEADTFTGKLKSAFREAFNVQAFALTAAAGIGLGFTTAFKRATEAAVSFASEFEFNLAKVRSIAGNIDLDIVEGDLQRIATTVPQDLNTLTDALFFTITSGIRDVTDAVSVLEVGAKAAVAGATDAVTSIDALTTILNAYQKDASEASNVSDILFRIVDQGKVTFDSLAAAIGDVANPAAVAGIRFEEVGAAVATVTKAGINVEETTTALRRLFSQIANATPQAKDLAASLGLNLSISGLEAAGSLQAFVQQVVQATNKSPELLDAVAGNERALRALNIIAGTASDEYQRIATLFSDTAFVAGSADRAFRILNDTAQNQYKLFKDSLNIAIKDFGDALIADALPAIRQLTEALSNQRPIDRYIDQMTKLGASTDQLAIAQKAREFITFRQRVQELGVELNKLVNTNSDLAAFLRNSGVDVGTFAFANDVFKDSKSFAQDLLRSTETVEGLNAAQNEFNRIASETTQRLSEMAELRTQEGEGVKTTLGLLEQEQNRENARLAILQKIVSDRIFELEAKGKIGLITEKELTFLKEIRDTQDQITRSRDEFLQKTIAEAQLQEKSKNVLAGLRDDLVRIGVGSEFEQRLLAIEERASKVQKEFAGFPEVVRASQKLAAAQIEQLFDEVIDKSDASAGKIRDNFVKTFDLPDDIKREFADDVTQFSGLGDFLAKNAKFSLLLEPKNLEIEVPERTTVAISDKIRVVMDDALSPIGDVFDNFLNEMELAGFALNGEFVDFVSVIDSNAGRIAGGLLDLGQSISNFANKLPGASIFGILNSGLGLLGIGGNNDFERLEAQRQRQIERERESAEATRALTTELENFVQAARQLSLRDINQQLSQTRESIQEIIGGPGQITQQQFEFLKGINEQAREIEQEIRFADDSRIEDQLREQLRAVLDQVSEFAELEGALTQRQLDELEILARQYDEINKTLDEFGKSSDTFADFMAELRQEFALFDIENISDQVNLFRKRFEQRFGIVLPQTADELINFAQTLFVGLRDKTGQELEDFLEDLGLADLAQDEFSALLRVINEFVDGINESAENVGTVDPVELSKTFLREITLGQANQLIDFEKTAIRQRNVGIDQRGQIIERLAGIDSRVESLALTVGNGTIIEAQSNSAAARNSEVILRSIGG